ISAHPQLSQQAHKETHRACTHGHNEEQRQRRFYKGFVADTIVIEGGPSRDDANTDTQQTDAPKDVHRSLTKAMKKNNDQQIKNDFRDSLQPIFGNASMPRTMFYRHLRHPGTVPVGVDRNEAMHLSIQVHSFECSATICL